MPRRPDHPELTYALGVLAALWPSSGAPEVTRRPRGARQGADIGEWLALPRLRRPRVLVPVGVPGAAGMLRRHSSGSLQQVTWEALAVGVRTGALSYLPAPRLRVEHARGPAAGRSVESVLAESLGPELHIGVLLGTPRANRKPVLAVFDSTGRSVAFVKVGVDDVTRALVTREAHNLRALAARELRTIEAPHVLAFDALADVCLLVLTPLSASAGKRWSGPPPLDAMAELSRSGGTVEMSLQDSDFWRRSCTAAEAVSTPVVGRRLAAAASAVLERVGSLSFEFGSWHGDWSPWNMGWAAGRVQLWDWERFEDDVPCGFDAVHYEAQRVRQGTAGLAAAEETFVADVAELLVKVGVPKERTHPTLVLYLLAVALRYLGGSAGGNLRAHPRGVWALDLLERQLGRRRDV